MEKKWIPISYSEEEVTELQKVLGVHRIFCQLLVQRGIKTYDQAKLFFRPSIHHLHDPFLMKDMDVAVERLEKAIQQKERILLYGDYDVDGTTCVSLMYSFLIHHHSNLDYYIPDRYKEGYGVSFEGIEYAKATSVSLIIAMDCGIKAHTKVDKAKELGIDFIICDHHMPHDTLPDAIAVLDAKRKDCTYPYKELSGCGVAFKLAQAYTDKHDLSYEPLLNLLDLLLVSIACDIVEMRGENRVLTFLGLQKLNDSPSLGLKALIDKSGKTSPLSIGDVVFGIGPMINAAGRLGDAKDAVKLLLSEDKEEATTMAEFLSKQNKERQMVDKQIVEEAKEIIYQNPNWKQLNSIVLFKKGWHKGVLGIAASRIVETFHRPTIILTESNGKAVGSARSISHFDIYESLKSCSHLMENFGGHAFAAGMTLNIDKVDDLRKQFEAEVSKKITPELLEPELYIAAPIYLKDINSKFWKILKQFAPFGPKNRRPIFRTNEVYDGGYSKVLKDKHLKLYVRNKNSSPFSGIGFGLGHHYDILKKSPIDLCFVLEENHYNGKTTLQLNVRDIKPSKI